MRVTKKKSLNQWLETLETQHNKKIDLGLERISKVYQRLKLKKIAPNIITVAGTNGKGSTVAILSSICQQASYKVGSFTSPHIIDFNERIKINDKNVTDDEIIEAFERIEQNLGKVTLSYFEYATLAALIVFKNKQVDVAILEVGLGGRLDSVNVVDTDCAIITTIDIDHTNWLGNTIESIAHEKAGIMRANTPVVYGDNNCPKSIVNHAQKINAQLHLVDNSIKLPELNIQGDYQKINAKTAITALKLLDKTIKISAKHIKQGLQNIQLTGRLQTINQNPRIIVDVSHNKQAAISLAHWLKNNPIEGKTIAVFGVLKDKQPMDWLHEFKDLIDCWCISSPKTSRAMACQELLMILADTSRLLLSFDSIAQAYKQSKIIAKPNDRILVFGSFYTVSEVMQA